MTPCTTFAGDIYPWNHGGEKTKVSVLSPSNVVRGLTSKWTTARSLATAIGMKPRVVSAMLCRSVISGNAEKIDVGPRRVLYRIKETVQ